MDNDQKQNTSLKVRNWQFPKKWNPRHEEILNMVSMGVRLPEVAAKLNYSVQYLRSIVWWPEFRERLAARQKNVADNLEDPQFRVDYYFDVRLGEVANEAISFQMDVIKNPNIDITARQRSAKDILDRFSPTSNKNKAGVTVNQQTNVNNLTFEDRLRMARATEGADDYIVEAIPVGEDRNV